MAFPVALGAAALSGGTNIVASHMTNRANIKMERETRRWNKKMWDLQNEYNHPTQAMARLQEAGLNPRLVYGGSPGGTTGQAGSVAPGKAPNMRYDIGDPVAAYQNAKMVTAQTQNLDAMKRLNDAKAIDTLNRGRASKINADALEAGGQRVLQGIIDQYSTYSANLERALAEANVAKGTQAARISQATEQLNNMVKDGKLKSLDAVYKKFKADLAEEGFTVGDNKWTRMLITQLEKTGALDQINSLMSDIIKDPMKVFGEMLLGGYVWPINRSNN